MAATTVEYVIYRHGSNGANQPMTQTMAIGIYNGIGKTAVSRRESAKALAAAEHTIYSNQWLDAIPASRVSADEQATAWENQMAGQPSEDFHAVGYIA